MYGRYSLHMLLISGGKDEGQRGSVDMRCYILSGIDDETLDMIPAFICSRTAVCANMK